jgi:putative pyoverdin transport system ATP-binding/permease protein
MRGLFRFLFATSPWTIVVTAVMALLAGLSSAMALRAINQMLASKSPGNVWLVFAAVCATLFGARLISQLLLGRLGQLSLMRLRNSLVQKIAAAPLRQLEEIGRARLISILANDTAAVGAAVPDMALFLTHIFIVLGVFAYLVTVHGLLFITIMGGILVGVVLYRIPSALALKAFTAARESQDRLFDHYRTLVEGTKELLLNRRRRSAFLERDVVTAGDDYYRRTLRGVTAFAITITFGETLFIVMLGVILLATEGRIASDTRTSFAVSMLYLTAPLQSIFGILPFLSRAQVAYRNLELFKERIEAGVIQHDSVVIGPQRIELQAVKYAYRHSDGEFELGPIDLHLQRGEIVMVVGSNGCGKTTLAKLVAGLYSPDNGRILLDGAEITESNRESLRECFSAIFSDTFLFPRISDVSSEDSDVERDIEMLGLREKVRVIDGSFSTTNLSTGQRRRLMLVTALAESRPFCVLDEWAADQDPAFRETFYRKVLPEIRARGCGALVISHDDRYYDVADRLLTLEYGKLVLAEQDRVA